MKHKITFSIMLCNATSYYNVIISNHHPKRN